MKIPSHKAIPVGIALFSLVIVCMLSAFLAGSIIPGELAYHIKWERIAKKNPTIASACEQCGYWFSHKDMRIMEIPTPPYYRWDCDECKLRLEELNEKDREKAVKKLVERKK